MKKVTQYILKAKNFLVRKIKNGFRILQDDSGMSIIELLLILVVIIALVVIFKKQLTTLVNTIFKRITTESAGI